MNRFLRLLVVALAPLSGACGGASPPSPSLGGAGASPAGELAADSCAGDPWLAQILGQRPEMSSTMRLAGMQGTRMWGAAFQGRQNVEMDYLSEFRQVRNSSAEVYEWEGPPSSSSSSGHETARVIVLRQAFGNPRAYVVNNETMYDAPITLASGVVEFPPSAANRSSPYPSGGRTLFTFGDGTWVRVDAWMAQQFRAAFSRVATSPPLPAAGPEVAWEVCAMLDGKRTVRSGVWGVAPQRGVLRLLAYQAKQLDAELVYRFPSAELATRAEAEQRLRCSQASYTGKSNDKGIFELIPPCKAIVGSSVDGSLLRYAVRF